MSRTYAVAILVVLTVLAAPAAQAQEFFGTYSGQGEQFQGSYLSFAVTSDRIEAISCRDRLLVDEMSVAVDDVAADGATVVASGPNATVTFHDTPTCHVKVVVEADLDVDLNVPASEVDVTRDGDRVALKRGVVAGAWSPDGDVQVDDGDVTASLSDGDSLMLRVRPGGSFPAMSAGPTEADISQAIEDGDVGAETFVQGGPRPGHAVSTFAPLDVTVELGDAVNLTVANRTEDTDGKVLVARVDDLAIDGEGEVQVAYDGEPLSDADDLSDVLDPHDDGIDAEQLVVSLDNSHVVLVSVPHFSVHTISIDRVAQFVQENPEIAAMTVVGAIAVVGLAVGGMFKPRKR